MPSKNSQPSPSKQPFYCSACESEFDGPTFSHFATVRHKANVARQRALEIQLKQQRNEAIYHSPSKLNGVSKHRSSTTLHKAKRKQPQTKSKQKKPKKPVVKSTTDSAYRLKKRKVKESVLYNTPIVPIIDQVMNAITQQVVPEYTTEQLGPTATILTPDQNNNSKIPTIQLCNNNVFDERALIYTCFLVKEYARSLCDGDNDDKDETEKKKRNKRKLIF